MEKCANGIAGKHELTAYSVKFILSECLTKCLRIFFLLFIYIIFFFRYDLDHDLVLGPSQCRFSVVCLLGMFAKNVNYFRNFEDADSAGLSVQCSRYLRKPSVRLI